MSTNQPVSQSTDAPEPVSFADEPIVLVDARDREVGQAAKADCHKGAGTLHRALSVFLFDAEGRTILQQRTAQKPLWPLYWSNSCCSHPRVGESVEAAAKRRVREELGVEAEMTYVYKFRYRAEYQDLGAEHELCWVHVGTFSGELQPHPDEIEAIRRLTPAELDAEIDQHPEQLTPWAKMEWRRLRQQFPHVIDNL